MIELFFALAVSIDAQSFPLCSEGRRVTCVVDGDTFWHNRFKYRLADIDAPEVANPRCEAETRLGRAATYRLAALLSDGSLELQEQGVGR